MPLGCRNHGQLRSLRLFRVTRSDRAWRGWLGPGLLLPAPRAARALWNGGSLRLLLSLVSVMEGVPSAEGGVPCAGPPLPDSQRSGLLQQPGCHPPALVQVLWQTININRISPRGPGKELCCLYEEGRLPHQPTSPRPHSFQGCYNKGFDGAQRHVAALHV